MKKAMGLVVAVAVAMATIGVADEAFARGGGSGGSGGSSGGPSGPSSAPSAAAPSAPSPSPSPSNLSDNMTDTTSVSAFPRFGVVIPGCTTTNFGSGGGTVPCPNR